MAKSAATVVRAATKVTGLPGSSRTEMPAQRMTFSKVTEPWPSGRVIVSPGCIRRTSVEPSGFFTVVISAVLSV